MLQSTFIHLPGIGFHREKLLWKSGILTWDDLTRTYLSQSSLFPRASDDALARSIEESRAALEAGRLEYFAEKLPPSEHYRIALHAPRDTLFLDIETTGLSLYYDEITLIGISGIDGYDLYIRGQAIERIAERIAQAKCIVTFNGGAFDLKFIGKEFPLLPLPHAHVDLRFFARRVGLAGGQKRIEEQLKIGRAMDIQDMRGERAPILWYRYTLGDIEAGKRLVEYNRADVEGMRTIFDSVLQRISGPHSRYPNGVRFATLGQAVAVDRSPSGQQVARFEMPRYLGRVGPRVTFNELLKDQRSRELRIVGIDLTGSSKRPTGWCLLAGDEAVTKTLSTDKQMVAETVDARPDLVSIDSPLSLPKGRRSVRDSDPGRAKYGIMRQCERSLKKRGVNVYPSLIPSMQKLTARGIRLAKTLRALGIPVIESYPGAAQDIMGIPRKRAGLDLLKRGLDKFGIRGEFLVRDVTHDEVDAVTSAAVGLFFWSGRFEALGNEDEEYLIIPDMHVAPDRWRKRIVVGISGPIASGKTTGAKYLEKSGFKYGRYSEVLAQMLGADGGKPSRAALQSLGERIHRYPGQRWLSKRLVQMVASDGNVVIDGLRFPEDHAFMVEAFGPAFIHIHITAPEVLRRERHIAMGNSRASFTRAVGHIVEQEIPLLAQSAHETIANDRTRDAYLAKIMHVIQKLGRVPAFS